MSVFDKLFRRKSLMKSNSLVPSNTTMTAIETVMPFHPDLQNLLWISDGPRKNYTIQEHEQVYECEGIRIVFSSFSSQEPSLISVRLPIQVDVEFQNIERPPYFPTYAGLTAAQRGVYWKFLADPYSGQFDIGYVFILYYGLERHLLEGRYEDAFHVILKLRDVYDNTSFQHYSACALILTCLIRQQPELANEFYHSLDKSYELNFSDNLYLLCKMGLNQPLTPQDIMRMSKSFEFTNQNYIKKLPEMFFQQLSAAMQSRFGSNVLEISKFVTQTEWRNLHKQSIPIFANFSIPDQSIDTPLISECFKLRKVAFDLLEQAHENLKSELAQMRKAGTIPIEKNQNHKKVIQSLSFDSTQEKELLSQYKKVYSNAMNKHFLLISMQNFYYKYRELDNKYLQLCIDYCNEDIALLPMVQIQHRREEQESLQKLSLVYSRKELAEKLDTIRPFAGDIPAFNRLAIIYEKSKVYEKAIDICNQAIDYYMGINMLEEVAKYEQRRQKIEIKVSKQ